MPELARLPPKFVHQPWSAPAAELSQAGVTLGGTYPRPIVDHKTARTEALIRVVAWSLAQEMERQGLTKVSDFFFQGVMALPYHIYVVSSKIPQNEYTERVQYGTAFVFLVIVGGIALASIVLRNKLRSRYRW